MYSGSFYIDMSVDNPYTNVAPENNSSYISRRKADVANECLLTW